MHISIHAFDVLIDNVSNIYIKKTITTQKTDAQRYDLCNARTSMIVALLGRSWPPCSEVRALLFGIHAAPLSFHPEDIGLVVGCPMI